MTATFVIDIPIRGGQLRQTLPVDPARALHHITVLAPFVPDDATWTVEVRE